MPRAHKKFFATGEWPCYFCGKVIRRVSTVQMSLVRHHINGDSDDHREKNIAPAHRICHHRHHMVGRPMPEETKRKLSEAMKGRVRTAEHRDNLSRSLRGWS